jgi:hypothetical protein
VQKVPDIPAELNGPESKDQHDSASDATVCAEIVLTAFLLLFREDAFFFLCREQLGRALLRIHQ